MRCASGSGISYATQVGSGVVTERLKHGTEFLTNYGYML